MEQSSSSPEKALSTANNSDGSEKESSKDAEIIGEDIIGSNQRRSRAAKEAAKRKLAEPDDGIWDELLERKKDRTSSSLVNRNDFRRGLMDSAEEETISGNENEEGGKKMRLDKMVANYDDEVDSSEDSESGSDDDSDEEEYEEGFEEDDDEEYEDDEEEEGPSNRRPIKRMAGMSPLKRPNHSTKSYIRKHNHYTTDTLPIKKPEPSAGLFQSSNHSSNQSVKSFYPPTKAVPSAEILQGYKDASYDGETTEDEKEDERMTPYCPSEISNTSTAESSIDMPVLERQEYVKDTIMPIKIPEVPKKSQQVFYRMPEPIIPTIEFAFPHFVARPSTIRPPLDIPLLGSPSFDSLSGVPCPKVYLNKMKVKGLVTTGQIVGEVAFKPELYMPESRVRVSMFFYNSTRDSDVWLRTPIANVSVRYGKEMKVPFVATLDMNFYLREGENSESLLRKDSLIREETMGFVGVVEFENIIRRSKEERMVLKKRPSILPYMYPRPIISSPIPSQVRSLPPAIPIVEQSVEDTGIALQPYSNFVLPPAGDISEKIRFSVDFFTITSGTPTIRPPLEIPIPGCPTVSSLDELSSAIPRILINKSKMREFVNSGTISGNVVFTPEHNWPEPTVRISIFYYSSIRNTTEWSRTPFFTFYAKKKREMRIEFTATVDMKVYLREEEDPTLLLHENSLLRSEILSFVAVVAAEGVVLRSKEERMFFRKKKRQINRQAARSNETPQAQHSAWDADFSGEDYVY